MIASPNSPSGLSGTVTVMKEKWNGPNTIRIATTAPMQAASARNEMRKSFNVL